MVLCVAAAYCIWPEVGVWGLLGADLILVLALFVLCSADFSIFNESKSVSGGWLVVKSLLSILAGQLQEH